MDRVQEKIFDNITTHKFLELLNNGNIQIWKTPRNFCLDKLKERHI